MRSALSQLQCFPNCDDEFIINWPSMKSLARGVRCPKYWQYGSLFCLGDCTLISMTAILFRFPIIVHCENKPLLIKTSKTWWPMQCQDETVGVFGKRSAFQQGAILWRIRLEIHRLCLEPLMATFRDAHNIFICCLFDTPLSHGVCPIWLT